MSEKLQLSNDELIDGKKKLAYRMFDKIAETYDLINLILSFGIDRYWRRFLLKHLPLPQGKGLSILDLATGTGEIAIALSRQHAKNVSKITAVDLSAQMIGIAEKKYQRLLHHYQGQGKELAPIHFLVADGVTLQLKQEELFDLVTIGFGIRNMYDPEKTLINCLQKIKKGGKILILELSVPQNSFFKKTFLCYFRYILPKLGGFISRDRAAYSYLNESVEVFPSGKNFADLLQKSGFSNIKTYPLTFGIANLYEGTR